MPETTRGTGLGQGRLPRGLTTGPNNWWSLWSLPSRVSSRVSPEVLGKQCMGRVLGSVLSRGLRTAEKGSEVTLPGRIGPYERVLGRSCCSDLTP